MQEELTHLIIGMSWLPALGFIACILLAVRFLKGKSAPITGNWAFDLALVACAAALGARAYDAFTAEGSYAPYYAPPLVLLLAVLHDRVAKRWPQARAAAALALLAVAVGLAAYAQGALYPHESTLVHTARGSFKTTAAAAPALQGTVNWIDSHTEPGEAVLAVPADAGIDFMTDRKVALYNPMFLPGLLYDHAEEAEAIARLKAEGVRYAVVDKRNFDNYPHEKFGVEYNRPFAAWIEREAAGRRIRRRGAGRRREPGDQLRDLRHRRGTMSDGTTTTRRRGGGPRPHPRALWAGPRRLRGRRRGAARRPRPARLWGDRLARLHRAGDRAGGSVRDRAGAGRHRPRAADDARAALGGRGRAGVRGRAMRYESTLPGAKRRILALAALYGPGAETIRVRCTAPAG